MRKIISVIVIALLLQVAVTSPVLGGISQSHHDYSRAGWSGGEICIVCHTPHNANTTVADAPLWNREVSTATYTVYTSSTLNALPGQPSGSSKLCLSCHDGTIAVDSFAGKTGTRFADFGNFGTDLSRHHPISFAYDSALASEDGKLHNPATKDSGLGGTIETDLLVDGQLECTSCHDVHVSRHSAGCAGCHAGSGHPFTTRSLSLRKSNAGSALCLTCHAK
ncbi:MAG: cytochrome C [Candidatus Hydrogenedentes bacterium]|nr:cytochrome C [Candidatus Hydrogenedentota bacterium]